MTNDNTRYSVDEALVRMGFGKFQFLVLFYTGIGWTSDAMEMMLLSFVGPAVESQWSLNSQQQSILTSVVFAGMLVGAYTWGLLSDKYGRRKGYLCSAVITSGAGLLSAFAPNYITLIIFRCLVGFGLGGVPVLLSWFLEFVPATNRGTWLVIFQGFWTLGAIMEAALAWIVMPRLGWRYLLGFSSLPSFLMLIFFPMTPESPRYYCLKGKKQLALKILEKVSALNKKQLPPGILITDSEIELQGQIPLSETGRAEADKSSPKLKDSDMNVFQTLFMLLTPKLVRSTLLLWVVFIGNAFSYYGLVLLTTELNKMGNTCHSKQGQHQKTEAASAAINYKDVLITSFAEMPGLVVAALIIDRLGRKISMAAVLFISCAFLLPLVARRSQHVTTILLFGARACITATFTTIYIYAPEIYPTSVRSTGVGVASAMGRIGGMVCPYVAIGLVHGCHQTAAILLFVGVIVFSGICVLFFPLETKGIELADSICTTNLEKPKLMKKDGI